MSLKSLALTTLSRRNVNQRGIPAKFFDDTAPIEYLVVGGGGSGTTSGLGYVGGGGGAGGFVTGTNKFLPKGSSVVVTVGAGGTAFINVGGADAGNPGTDSTVTNVYNTSQIVSTIRAYAGGGGWGGGGGSGAANGGQGVFPGSSYISEERQGYSGALNGGISPAFGSPGGGGAGANGSDGTGAAGGAGGVGLPSSITGTSTYYAGGGGGGALNTYPGGAGGNGGGGAGGGAGTASVQKPGIPGTANTGGAGGGKGGANGTAQISGNGGSGVVIIRTTRTAVSTTGSPTVTTDGSYNIYKFTTSGTITF